MARTRINETVYDHVAEYIHSQWKRRVANRSDLDRQIKEIDRQIAMKPKNDHKLLRNGTKDPKKAWLPEIELPLQAEALETLTSDSRAMQFPDSGPWFASHSAVTDEYLARSELSSIIAGDENDVPTLIGQDAADKLVSGFLNHWHRQYDFHSNVDVINAEAISYGAGVGRVKNIQKSVFLNTARGVVREDKTFPVLIPRTLKESYLEDREHILMHEGFLVGPLTIFYTKRALQDVLDQAKKGSKDPNSETGGWRPKIINKLDPDSKGNVEFLEAEGDFIIPRKTTGSIHLPGTLITVAIGKNVVKVVRLRFRKHPFDSVLEFHYNKENIVTPYGSSPLRKGLPLQAMAVEALMRVIEASALNSQPPIGYDRSDMWFAQQGGPIIEPRAIWATISEIIVHEIGDPSALMQIYLGFLAQYADAVGIHRARLGAQTVSHTTAFAKNAELQRGQVRTVDYVRGTLQGPLTRFLDMEYKMSRQFKGKQMFWIDAYRGFVEIESKHLPDHVVFEAHGAGEPQEQQLIRERKEQSLREALQMDQINIQLGGTPIMNLNNSIEETLLGGGWADVDKMMNTTEDNLQGPAALPAEPAVLNEELGLS